MWGQHFIQQVIANAGQMSLLPTCYQPNTICFMVSTRQMEAKVSTGLQWLPNWDGDCICVLVPV